MPPISPPKECASAGCYKTADKGSGYCVECRSKKKIEYRKTQKEYDENRSEDHDFYHSPQWRRLRARYARQNPLCEDCREKGIITRMDVVDHKEPRKDRPDLELVYSNLRSLCHHHHNKKTAKETKARRTA